MRHFSRSRSLGSTPSVGSVRSPGAIGSLGLALALALGVPACGGARGAGATPGTTAPGGGPGAPAAGFGGLLAADGTRVAAEVVFQGDCAPAGSRGGCHTITLRPDGSYRNFLYDAAIDGTYTITGAVVRLTGPDPALIEELTLSADGTHLGEMVRQP